MDDVQVTKMEFPDENGGISLTAKHPAFAALALDCAAMFKESGGINYCEWTMTAPEIGPFILIIQRKGAVTPAEMASKYREVLEWIVGQKDLFFAECTQAEEIVSRCQKALRPL